MESPYHGSPVAPISHDSGSRPSLGFPLGTALLLLVVFSLSGVFSCCYHWDKLRRTFALREPDLEAPSAKPNFPNKESGKPENQSLPVIMPGDDVPKFIALPCPCEPPRPTAEVVVHVPKPPQPQKPPRIGSPFC